MSLRGLPAALFVLSPMRSNGAGLLPASRKNRFDEAFTSGKPVALSGEQEGTIVIWSAANGDRKLMLVDPAI